MKKLVLCDYIFHYLETGVGRYMRLRTHSVTASEEKARQRSKRIWNGEDLQDFQTAQFCPTKCV